MLGRDGRKLSKSDAALPVDPLDPLPALHAAWRWLGQAPDALTGAGDVPAILTQAQAAFVPEAIPARRARLDDMPSTTGRPQK